MISFAFLIRVLGLIFLLRQMKMFPVTATKVRVITWGYFFSAFHSLIGMMLQMPGYQVGDAIGSLLAVVLIMITIEDIERHRISHHWLLMIVLLAVASSFIWAEPRWWERVLGMISVSGLLLFLSCLRPGAFGGGDVKLMAAAGMLLGPPAIWSAFVLAVLLAGGYSGVAIALGKLGRHDEVALGPFLGAGIWVFWVAFCSRII